MNIKLNDVCAKRFFNGDFGKLYKRDMIDHLLQVIENDNSGSLQLENSFFDRETDKYDLDDFEISVVLKLQRIAEKAKENPTVDIVKRIRHSSEISDEDADFFIHAGDKFYDFLGIDGERFFRVISAICQSAYDEGYEDAGGI